ncbi:MAG: 1-deoxy-D-xylulose-5-phosphate reductoisomerase [Acidiferrobacteraceae bacterium]|nr:1-deoxy-D-xylulose-5-phosphate reductoisomerase [Acidiferrobacteraceae bacterium]
MTEQMGVAVLGATGSIGSSALDVLRLHRGQYKVVSLTGWKRISALKRLLSEFTPAQIAAEPESGSVVETNVLEGCEGSCYLGGEAGLVAAATHPDVDTVIAGVSGAAGLQSTLAAVEAGKRVLIANKEPLVMCGQLLRDAASGSGACLMPIDSEHNAIFQCLPLELQRDVTSGRGIGSRSAGAGVSQITLTASGGPFLRTSAAEISNATPAQALAHPTWNMGPKISVDSATLMNKGLELIEACSLFGLDESQIDIIIHPQSVLHSMVGFNDGSLIGQMGNPDMRIPISYGLGYPDRVSSGIATMDLAEIGQLDFERPDLERFPSLILAREAAKSGRSVPIALNAANEIAVEAFLDRRIAFGEIPEVVDRILQNHKPSEASDLEQAVDIDLEVRALASEMIRRGLSS